MEEILENEICVRYERNNGVNYAVIDTKEEWKCEDDYEVKMLMLNTPEYFLHITMNYIDEKNSIYYDISSKQQLSKLFEYGKVTMEDVKSLFDNISRMVRVVDEYMLNLDRVILNPQDIYVSLSDKKYSFMYSPVAGEKDFYDKMRSLFEYILERFDHSVKKSSLVKFYEIYQRILVRDYTPDKLMEFFDDENEGIHIINEEDLTDGRADNAYGEDNAYGRDRAYGEDNANGKNNDYVKDINYAGNNNYARDKTYIRNNNRVKGKAYTKDNDSIIDMIYDRNDNYNKDKNYAENYDNSAHIHNMENGRNIDSIKGVKNKKLYRTHKSEGYYKTLKESCGKENKNQESRNRQGENQEKKIKQDKNNKVQSRQNNNYNNNNNFEGTVIKDVMPEIINTDKPDKRSKKAAFIIKAVATVLVLNAIVSMFFKSYAVIKIGTTASIICIIVGLAIFYITDKAAKVIGELINEDKVTEDELIPYRMHNYGNKTENGIAEDKASEAQVNTGLDNEYGKQKDNNEYDNMVTAKVIDEEEEQPAQYGNTVLLSDYLNMLKDNKLTLKITDTDSEIPLYVKKADGYEAVIEKLEPDSYPCTIGSLEESSDIYIASPIISKMHACIIKDEDKFYIEDMNSTNGTFINGERIAMHNKMCLSDGDALRIASYEFVVKLS